jgi:Beta-lactamase enzyme family
MTHDTLAQALRQAVLDQHFELTADTLNSGAPIAHFPSIDLALVVFPPHAPPVWANVLFSREHPQGLIGAIPSDASELRHIRFDRDVQGAWQGESGTSVAWLPGSDWKSLAFPPLHGQGPHRFVVPYPASLMKLMVAVGVGLAVDRGLAEWPEADARAMITVSDNDATDRCVALLHRANVVGLLHDQLARYGLPTLRMERTTAAGGWRNGNGSGVGHIHMTAWDTARLLWLLDAKAQPAQSAPPAPWLSAAERAAPLLKEPTRLRLVALLAAQELNEILSSEAQRAATGWVPGIPPSAGFAHKTGTTQNYASDAGLLTGDVHAIVAVITNLGTRYAPQAPDCKDCATTWRLPALGAALHRMALQAAKG